MTWTKKHLSHWFSTMKILRQCGTVFARFIFLKNIINCKKDHVNDSISKLHRVGCAFQRACDSCILLTHCSHLGTFGELFAPYMIYNASMERFVVWKKRRISLRHYPSWKLLYRSGRSIEDSKPFFLCSTGKHTCTPSKEWNRKHVTGQKKKTRKWLSWRINYPMSWEVTLLETGFTVPVTDNWKCGKWCSFWFLQVT